MHTPAMPDESTHRFAVYWFKRAYQLTQGRCFCGATLTPQQVEAKALCDGCTERDAERIRRLNAGGLQG